MPRHTVQPKRFAPHIWPSGMRAEDRESGQHLGTLLNDLLDYLWRYEVALDLLQESKERISALTAIANSHKPQSEHWNKARAERDVVSAREDVSIREAILVLYHFGSTLDAICAGLSQNKTLSSLIDKVKLFKAKPLFKTRFPDPVVIRNAIGHEADLVKTAAMKRENAYKETLPEGRLLTVERLQTDVDLQTGWKTGRELPHTGSTLFHPINGKMVRGELSPEGVELLRSVVDLVLVAFQPASDGTRALIPRPPGL